MALLLFLLATTALASLLTAPFVALRSLFPFRQAQFAQVFPLKPAPDQQHQQVCHFSFTPLWLSLCPLLRLSFYFNLSDRSNRSCLLFPTLLSGCNESPNTHFFRGTTLVISCPCGVCYSWPLQSLVEPFLLPLVFTLLFSDLRRTVSPKFLDTQVSLVSTEKLVLPLHTRCVFCRLRCNYTALC